MTSITEVMPDVVRVLTYMQTYGKLPTVACDELGIPYRTFDYYTQSIPELSKMRFEAEDRLYDMMAEALVCPDDHPVYGRTDPKMAAIMSRNIQWLLARRRQRYGDKVINEHIITADKEVLNALQAAKARAHGATPTVSVPAAKQLTSEVVEILVADATGVMRPETDDERIERELLALL